MYVMYVCLYVCVFNLELPRAASALALGRAEVPRAASALALETRLKPQPLKGNPSSPDTAASKGIAAWSPSKGHSRLNCHLAQTALAAARHACMNVCSFFVFFFVFFLLFVLLLFSSVDADTLARNVVLTHAVASSPKPSKASVSHLKITMYAKLLLWQLSAICFMTFCKSSSWTITTVDGQTRGNPCCLFAYCWAASLLTAQGLSLPRQLAPRKVAELKTAQRI